MWKNNITLGISLFGLFACAPALKSDKDYGPELKRETLKYKGETNDYDVEVQETVYGYSCEERVIILKGKNMSHTNSNYVSYIWARDRGCDDRIDNLRIKGFFTRTVDRYTLEQDILNAFYRAKYTTKSLNLKFRIFS